MLRVYRRDLHQIPELAMREFKTSEYIKKALAGSSFDLEQVLDTGVLAFKKSNNPQAVTIGFRGDMDALPMLEKNNLEYKSRHEGVMHACGHDGHMAMLLELARVLDSRELNVNVLLIFQPAEEDIGGAQKIVEGGFLQKYSPVAIFGSHIMPELEQGAIGMKPSSIMAAAAELDVEVFGKASHCARPQMGVDAIAVGGELIHSYEQILSKQISPFDTGIIHIGSFHSGSVRNIVSNYAKLLGTIRTFDDQVLEHIKESILRVNLATEHKYACTINTRIKDVYPAVVNDAGLYRKILGAMDGERVVDAEPSMAAEDFAYYGRICPTLFSFIGSKSAKYNKPLHHEEFDFDEAILDIGLSMYLKIIANYNGGY